MMKTHLLTRYVDWQTALRVRIDALEGKGRNIKEAIEDADARPTQVTREIRGRLQAVIGLSIIPGLGFGAAILAASLVRRLKKLIPTSTVAPGGDHVCACGARLGRGRLGGPSRDYGLPCRLCLLSGQPSRYFGPALYRSSHGHRVSDGVRTLDWQLAAP